MEDSTPFGVHSEVGQLRKVLVCAPGRAHRRLTPTNCDTLLFDEVMWVENAKRDHLDFVQKMRDRGVDGGRAARPAQLHPDPGRILTNENNDTGTDSIFMRRVRPIVEGT